MDKNWLIRTKSNHILGPVSKEKVLELYHNGSIKGDDEVCSGNGYWFFIREEDMVERFLLGSELQGFNPISEAKDVITQSGQSQGMEAPTDDITMIGGINLSMLKEPPAAPEVPAPKESAAPPLKPAQPALKETVPAETKKKNNVGPKPKQLVQPKKPLKKQNWLKYIGYLGFIILILLVYYRKSIIQHLFQGELTQISFSLLNVAHAQEVLPEKKKSF